MADITYNGSDDENWHSFESIPINTDILFNGNIPMKITECHNPCKWVVHARYTRPGDKDYTDISFFLQKDFPFKIFEVIKPKKPYGHSDRTYSYPPAKYQGIYDLFMQIIEGRKRENINFVCGNVVLKAGCISA